MRFGDSFIRELRLAGYHLDSSRQAAATRDVRFTIWVSQLRERRARDDDRDGRAEAEDGCGGIGVRDGSQHSWVEKESREGACVFLTGWILKLVGEKVERHDRDALISSSPADE